MVEKGRLICKPKTFSSGSTSLVSQVFWFIVGCGLILGLIFLIYLQLFWYVHPSLLIRIVDLIGTVLFLSLLLWGMSVSPLTETRIYENGISSDSHFLLDFLQRKTFHPFEEITKIGYAQEKTQGIKEVRKTIILYEGNPSEPVASFWSCCYEDEFMDVLTNTFIERCPEVTWEGVDLDSLSWKLTGNLFTNKKLVSTSTTPPIPLCPTCSRPIFYIPEYERWYCYNCENYAY